MATLAPAAKGSHFTIVWATDEAGQSPAREFYLGLAAEEQAKVVVLFQRLADQGRINNREQFRQLGDRARAPADKYWEFKRFQTRFIGEFRPGKIFAIAIGCTKKKDRLDPQEIARATRILEAFIG